MGGQLLNGHFNYRYGYCPKVSHTKKFAVNCAILNKIVPWHAVTNLQKDFRSHHRLQFVLDINKCLHIIASQHQPIQRTDAFFDAKRNVMQLI
jgi:hypothetical protein